MLKLRKVELFGFKSFCEKTHLTFSGGGITCIVGPNGCGKSNIADAISWVLGEQSHKMLRAERMADCIFNGTQKRPPLGMAEVTLTLIDPELAEAAEKVLNASPEEEAKEEVAAAGQDVNTEFTESTELAEDTEGKPFRKKREAKPAIRTKPGEVVVGRRLYRSGQSEYLINGRVARLRDVQELFMGTGLGPDSYAIIEQGRIGQILSSKPMDRRAIIEEAAGVTKYKTKRRLAEAKLESSKLNLSRVNDILVEVEKQLGSLKRQASKARRHAEIREQMRGLIRSVLASKAAELDAEAERLTQLLKEISASETEQTQALTALETEQERLARRNYELETELRQNQNLIGQTALELDRAENRIGFNRERMRELETRLTQIATEIELSRQQATQLEERVQAHAVNVVDLREDEHRLATALQELAERAAALAAEQQATETRIEELRQSSGRLGEELRRLHGEQAQAEEALAHHAEAQARLEMTAEKLRAEAGEHQQRAAAAESTWQGAEAEAQRLEQAVRTTQGRLAHLRGEQQQHTHRVERTREELTTVRARHKSVEQILNERSYSDEAVQKLFAANGKGENRGFRAVGLLADYAEVQEQYEVAVEQFLRDELEYVVVETFDHARAGISLLREEMGGQATFFVDSLRNLKLSSGEPPVPFHAQPGIVSRLDKLVEFRDPLGAAAKQFLPRLQSAYVVETSGVAEQLARENPGYHFLTIDGTCYSGRMVSGGRPGEAGPLAMKRELRAMEVQAIQLERDAEAAQAALRQVEQDLAACERSLNEAIAHNVEAQKSLVAAQLQHELARSESAKADERLAECSAELAHLGNGTRAARERAEQARLRQSEASDSHSAAETEVIHRSEKLIVIRQDLQAQQEEVSRRRAELATLSERLASAESVAARIDEELRQVREREASLTEQQAGIARERAELEGGTAEQERRVESLRAEKSRLEELRKALDAEWESVRVRTVEVDDALRMARQKLGDLREQRGQHEIERARNESDRNHLRETCLTEVNAHPEDLIAQEPRLLTGEELAAAENGYREMRAKIEAMGPINMMALE